MTVDYGVSSDCINLHSYGNICIRCGYCSYNPNYRDRIIKCIRYYKEMLKEKESFNGWFYNKPDLIEIQKINIFSDIKYYKRKIRICKKVLKTMVVVESSKVIVDGKK